jgi:hypothetical protein
MGEHVLRREASRPDYSAFLRASRQGAAKVSGEGSILQGEV